MGREQPLECLDAGTASGRAKLAPRDRVVGRFDELAVIPGHCHDAGDVVVVGDGRLERPRPARCSTPQSPGSGPYVTVSPLRTASTTTPTPGELALASA